MIPPGLGGRRFLVWRIDKTEYASVWDSGEGAYRYGGRWNSAGVRAVYCALDPSTTILEVAVHKGFGALNVTPHVLTAAHIQRRDSIYVVDPATIPNTNWLHPCAPSAGQQAFGDALLARHRFVALPSVVSTHSWNLIFTAGAGGYDLHLQEAFALDTRLHPPKG